MYNAFMYYDIVLVAYPLPPVTPLYLKVLLKKMELNSSSKYTRELHEVLISVYIKYYIGGLSLCY